MMGFWLLVGGFLLGIRHATDSDHVVAVSTLVADRASVWQAALVGAFWGLGHTAALLVAGGVVIGFGVTIPDSVATGLEAVVGFVILGLGLRLSLSALRRPRGSKHLHPIAVIGKTVPRRAFLIGLLHGLAGSAALTLLVLTEVVTTQGPTLGLVYLGLFGMGSLLGMLGMSLALSLPLRFLKRRLALSDRALSVTIGTASAAFGLLLLVSHAATIFGT